MNSNVIVFAGVPNVVQIEYMVHLLRDGDSSIVILLNDDLLFFEQEIIRILCSLLNSENDKNKINRVKILTFNEISSVKEVNTLCYSDCFIKTEPFFQTLELIPNPVDEIKRLREAVRFSTLIYLDMSGKDDENLDSELLEAGKESGFKTQMLKIPGVCSSISNTSLAFGEIINEFLIEIYRAVKITNNFTTGYFELEPVKIHLEWLDALIPVINCAEIVKSIQEVYKKNSPGIYRLSPNRSLSMKDLLNIASNTELGVRFEFVDNNECFNIIDKVFNNKIAFVSRFLLSHSYNCSELNPHNKTQSDIGDCYLSALLQFKISSIISDFAEETDEAYSVKPDKITVGTDLYYYKTGSGPYLTFITPFGIGIELWGRLIRRLRKHFTVIVYESREFYNAPVKDMSKSFDLLEKAGEINQIFDHEGIKNSIFFGHCNGAQIAMQFSVLFPGRVKGNILTGLRYSTEQVNNFLAPMLSMYSAIMTNDTILEKCISYSKNNMEINWSAKELKNAGEKIFVRTPKEAAPYHLIYTDNADRFRNYVWFTKTNYECSYSHLLQDVKAPVICISGEYDQQVSCSQAEEAASILPDAKAYIVKGGTHVLSVENDDDLAILCFYLEHNKHISGD